MVWSNVTGSSFGLRLFRQKLMIAVLSVFRSILFPADHSFVRCMADVMLLGEKLKSSWF